MPFVSLFNVAGQAKTDLMSLDRSPRMQSQ